MPIAVSAEVYEWQGICTIAITPFLDLNNTYNDGLETRLILDGAITPQDYHRLRNHVICAIVQRQGQMSRCLTGVAVLKVIQKQQSVEWPFCGKAR